MVGPGTDLGGRPPKPEPPATPLDPEVKRVVLGCVSFCGMGCATTTLVTLAILIHFALKYW